MKQYITVGRIISPWGVRGQVKVEPLTDDIERFKNLKEVFYEQENCLEKLVIKEVIFLKKAFVVLKFEGVDDAKEAEKFRNKYIMVHRKDAVKLPEGRYFICDIIGLKVYTVDDEYLGEIINVIQTGANDVYVIKNKENKEILIPAIKEVVKNIDIEKGIMFIFPMEGLI
ncbi:ribosome maturation factor RimM [Thermovenabulum gondwanense]|uniref:Ribosome maturation factor RimM n=1 Tax=Thermovenabulum gondwanense TaxID=520767 RepID=A0A161QC52_9FIRM|nr:ribosome maturation factor RimM [Thermovenabulum gondwanense]KYO66789.1 Ribosome maturation factor RimM [Thermovenabulum gondwanense]